MENKFKESRFIEQIMVMGEGKKYPCALIVPNYEFVKEWADRKGVKVDKSTNAVLCSEQAVIDRIQKRLICSTEQFGQWEKIKDLLY